MKAKLMELNSVSVVTNVFRLPHVNCRKPVARRKEKGRLYFFQMEQVIFEEKQVKYNSVTLCYYHWNDNESLWTVYWKRQRFLGFLLIWICRCSRSLENRHQLLSIKNLTCYFLKNSSIAWKACFSLWEKRNLSPVVITSFWYGFTPAGTWILQSPEGTHPIT